MMYRKAAVAAAVAIGSMGCAGSGAKPAAAPGATTSATCTALGNHVVRFAAVLEDASETGKTRRGSYAGVLEMLLTFERASGDLDAQLATMSGDGPSMRDALKGAGAALGLATAFARTQREQIERQAGVMGPLAKEADVAYPELRAACEAQTRRGAKTPAGRECAPVMDTLKKIETGPFTEQVLGADELAAMRLTTAPVVRARDRAVAATRALKKSVDAQAAEMVVLGKKWAVVEKSVGEAFQDFSAQCKDTPHAAEAKFLSESKPDPRKLTVLVRVKPPAGIDETFEELAEHAKDDATRAFYQARAQGAFGSGFVVVRATAAGTETLIITNRHVVELSDRAAIELADGTSLGAAEIVYTDPLHDVAVLRPAKKLPFDKGFAFATSAAKDQQGVVATGFPGMGGRPSYQTTRGYVSNESFKIDDNARPLTYVQHTAPIDPGSSGGPLTDERGFVLGVNTLKVTNREGVGLAVPSESILETLRRSDATESKRSSAPDRRESARLACLSLVAELASKKPRMLTLETMISNDLTSSEGLSAAMAIDDEDFGQIWQHDSVRAMRIATLVRLGSVLGAAGGANSLETCTDVNADDVRDILSADEVRYRVRLGNWETREIAFKWEQGHWKLARIDLHSAAKPMSVAAKLAPTIKPGAVAKPPAPKKKK
jgi:S1-C subfamily serine protease